MDNTCALSLYGDYQPARAPVPTESEADVYSAFVDKAASLGWSSTYSETSTPLLWGMHDAHLQENRVDAGLFARFRVGIDQPKNLPWAAGPLLPLALSAGQAVEDFGEYNLTAAEFFLQIETLSGSSRTRV